MANNIFQPQLIEEAEKRWASLRDEIGKNVEVLVQFRKETMTLPSQYLAQLDNIKKAQESVNNATTKAKKSQNQLTAAQKEAERQEKRNLALKTKLVDSNSRLTKENARLNEQLKVNNRENREAAKSTLQFRNAYDRLNNELKEAEKNYRNLAASQGLSNKATIKAQKEVQRLRGRVDKINKPIKRFGDNVGNYPKLLGSATSAFKGLIGAFGIVEGLRLGVSFAKDAAELARQAKGVEFAFERLGIEGQQAFDKIKRSTRGVLSDLEIKRSLNEFDNFNISLEQTDVLFEFLAVRAAQTGRSVDSLRDSLVEGLSKESKLRIDNLGISMAELNEELEKAPDFVTAVANIAKTEIAEAGNILDEATSSQDKFNAAFENFKVSAGSGFIGNLIAEINDLGTAFLDAASTVNEASDGFIDFLLNASRLVNPVEAALLKAEALAKKDLKERKKIVDEIISLQKERGLSQQQLIDNERSLLKLGKEQLQNILKSFEDKEGLRDKEIRDIAFINELIRKQQELLLGATNREQAKVIQDRIKNLEKERDAILGVADANKALRGSIGFYQKLISENKRLIETTITLQNLDEKKRLEDENAEYQKQIDLINGIIEAKKGEGLGLIDTLVLGFDSFQRENPIKEATRDVEGLKKAVDAFLQSFTSDVFSDAGLSSLEMFFDGTFKDLLDGADSLEEKFAVTFNAITEVAQEAYSIIGQLGQQNFEAEFERLEKNKELALQFAGDSAEAREEIDRQYEERRAEIQRKQAEANKRQALFNIIINTAQGIVSALASVPPNIPLSIAIGAIGAAQAAVVASQPIPQFKDGVRNFEGGLAILGDGGRPEIGVTPSGNVFKTPAKDTLYDLPKGTDIYKSQSEFDKELKDMLAFNGILPERNNMPEIKIDSGISKDDFERGINLLAKKIGNQEGVYIDINERGLNKYYVKGATRRQLLNNRAIMKGRKV